MKSALRNTILSAAIVSTVTFGATAVQADGYGVPASRSDEVWNNIAAEPRMSGDIVATAMQGGRFDTLIAAIEAAGLAATLGGDGPFTLFAPTDEAFAKVPAETLAALLADKDALTKVLTYHVVSGRVSAADAVKAGSAVTVNGQSVTIDGNHGRGVSVDGAQVVVADIRASNGIIHVIDQVILPD